MNGVPPLIRGLMNGKLITIVRATPQIPRPVVRDPAVMKRQIKQLTEKLDALPAMVLAKTMPGTARQSRITATPVILFSDNTKAPGSIAANVIEAKFKK